MVDSIQKKLMLSRSHLGVLDTIRVGSLGLRTRKFRAGLSAIGITIGIASVVGILGLSESGKADLIRELDSLGTNLLTVEAGEGFGSSTATLPESAASMISRIGPVYQVATISKVSGPVFRNNLIDDGRTRGITVVASDLNLLESQKGSLKTGFYFSSVTSEYPITVLGAVAAERLGIRRLTGAESIWIGDQWFRVIGILNPLSLAADLDRAAIIGYGSAKQFLDHDQPPDVVYVRAYPEHIHDVRSVLAATANPENPEEIQVSRASDVLEARAAASGTFTNLFVGLGAVALLVGGIGIANVMVIAVIERRNEIGLRRALGATRLHIGIQFLSESLLLSTIGGISGILLGILVTSLYAGIRGWPIVVPGYTLIAGLALSLLIGVIAGFYPALRAANMAPTEALRTR